MFRTLWNRWVCPICTGQTRHVALPVALVVGTIIALVNQGARLFHGDIDLVTVIRIVLDYAIPYLVASIGFLNGGRAEPQSQHPGQSTTPPGEVPPR